MGRQPTTHLMKPIINTLLGAFALSSHAMADVPATATAINHFGLDLHLRLAGEGGNQVASPWSIESALGMTYAGAAGKTKEEMAKVLHFPEDEASVHAGFAKIAKDLEELASISREQVKQSKAQGGPNTPLEIVVANRLFGQGGYPFEKPFLTLMEETYRAPFEIMDFIKAPDPSRLKINQWVEKQTKERIKDLIPANAITDETRLVLTNAIYMKATWADEFSEEPNSPFFVNGTDEMKLPGLIQENDFGYQKIPGGAIVSVPYAGGGLQFLLMIPDDRDGLMDLEKALTTEILNDASKLPRQLIRLHFPQFKLEPESVMLAKHLVAMGMPTAFDKPKGSADFSRMAPRKPDDYLCISNVIHKAFIAVDKYGTEAAAATAVVMMRATSIEVDPPKPLDIRVDRPFAFAIQHTQSGACLFLGRVTDPR
jgi:serpin B